MIVRTTPRLAMLGPRLRNVVLVLFALFVSHDAIYISQFGIGDRLAQAMTEGGHDAYWAPANLVVGGGVAVIFLAVIGVLARLERQAARAVGEPSPGPSYMKELASTWLLLFPAVGLLFALQENIEHFVTDGHLVGLDALLGYDSQLVIPVLAATTFVLAALGSVVRWRIRALRARIAATLRQAYPRVRATRRPLRWATIAAAIAHRWILDRRDAGRAPPRILVDNVVATA